MYAFEKYIFTKKFLEVCIYVHNYFDSIAKYNYLIKLGIN